MVGIIVPDETLIYHKNKQIKRNHSGQGCVGVSGQGCVGVRQISNIRHTFLEVSMTNIITEIIMSSITGYNSLYRNSCFKE